jgi:tape measure domain-containing protein
MLAGSGIASDTVRQLHDNILMIAKIKGLDPGQLSAGVMNLGKMLEAGTMDARHLRPLEMQLSGIGKFIADEMGTTIHGLAVMRNKGLLSAADPMVLLKAVEKQAASLAQFLPESTQTLASGMAEVSNAWLDFKNNLVLEHKEDIVQVMHAL